MNSSNWISSMASVIMAFGLIIVWWQLQAARKSITADHERSRRELAIKLVAQWIEVTDVTPEVTAVRMLVASLNQDQCRGVVNNKSFAIPSSNLELAKEALSSILKGSDLQEENGKIIFQPREIAHMKYIATRYLNRLEAVLMAWNHSVADTDIIESEFQYLVSPESSSTILEPFRKAMGGVNTYPAIHQFVETIQKKNLDMAKGKKPIT